MKRNFKNACIMACSALLAGAVAIAVPNLSSVQANADTDVTFKMTDGAEIRLLADNSTVAGIRFSSEISKAYIDSLDATTVVLKSSVDKMNNADENEELTEEWVLKGDGAVYNENAATNKFYHTISFSDLKTAEDIIKAAGVELTATMWLEADGAIVNGSLQSTTRSMRGVANYAYPRATESQKQEISDYLGTRTESQTTLSYTYSSESYVPSGENEYITVAKTTMSLPTGYEGYCDVYDGPKYVGTWNSGDETSDLRALFNGVGTSAEVSIFDENNNVYIAPVQYDYKLIERRDDFQALKSQNGTSANPGYIDGAYALKTNFEWTGSSVADLFGKNHSVFCGQLNGMGYNVKIWMPWYGVLGAATDTTVLENISFTFTGYRGVYTDASQATYCCLFKFHKFGFQIRNVYLKYECDNTAYSPVLIGTGLGSVTEEGLNGTVIENVVIDMSMGNVTIPQSRNFGYIYEYDTSKDTGNGNLLNTLRNVVVITSQKTPIQMNGSGSNTWFAQNDTELKAHWDSELSDNVDSNNLTNGKSLSYQSYQYYSETGKVVNRYDDYAAYVAQEGATKVGNWAITADGVAWTN